MESAPRRRSLKRRLVLLSATAVLTGLLAAWFVGGMLTAAHPSAVGSPPDDFPAQTISLSSESGATISGWHLDTGGDQGVIVLAHPLRGSRLTMLDRARWLVHAGYSVVMIDLQAHGESTGDRITLGFLEQHDVQAAVEFARTEHRGEPIGVIGWSLGGASALYASPLDIDALVIESVYPNIRDAVRNRVAGRLGPLAAVPAELLLCQLQPRFGISPSNLRPIDQIGEVGCPIFVISGEEDSHTTAEETRRMFAAARDPKQLWVVHGAGHEDLYAVAQESWQAHVLEFLAKHLRANGLAAAKDAAEQEY